MKRSEIVENFLHFSPSLPYETFYTISKCNSQTLSVVQMEHSTSTPNECVWRIAQLAKKSEFQPPRSFVLTADVFHFFFLKSIFGRGKKE